MKNKEIPDPVSLIIEKCRQGEDEATRIFHLLAEERQHHFTLDDGTDVHLNEEQLGEFAERFSSEVETIYWVSKRRKR